MKKNKIILLIGGFSFLLLMVFLSLLLGDRFQARGCGCPRVVSYNFIWIFIFLSVIFVSSLLYYLFSLKICEKDKSIKKNLEILDIILNKNEKAVLKILSKNSGEIEQKKISLLLGKINAHRTLKKLIEKKIIFVEKKGKNNKIKLNDFLKKEIIE